MMLMSSEAALEFNKLHAKIEDLEAENARLRVIIDTIGDAIVGFEPDETTGDYAKILGQWCDKFHALKAQLDEARNVIESFFDATSFETYDEARAFLAKLDAMNKPYGEV